MTLLLIQTQKSALECGYTQVCNLFIFEDEETAREKVQPYDMIWRNVV